MKVRIIESPDYDGVFRIETWHWYAPWWSYQTSEVGLQRATERAKKLLNPLIINITNEDQE